MLYKSLVTFMRDLERDRPLLSAAATLAQDNDAHLSTLCLGIDQTEPGIYYAGANAIALQQTLSVAQSEALSVTEATREALGGWPIPWDAEAVTTQIGALGSVIADKARMSDLVVLAQPYGPGRDVCDVTMAEATLFGARAPLLVLPADHDGGVAPRGVVIAWNDSFEAISAVRAAMPFLSQAETVHISIVDPPRHGPDRSDPGGVLAQWLSRHGVRVEISVLAKSMHRVSDVLIRHCADVEAGMVVMGGYGHSRFRETLLGGATREMLEHATVPVLMHH